MIRHTTVKNLPRTASVAGGARRRKTIEGKRRRYFKGTQRRNPPAARLHGGGDETKKCDNQHKKERCQYLQSHRGGGVPSS